MGKRGWMIPELRKVDQRENFVKKSYYVEEEYEKILVALAALTGKEISYLVNEALADLVDKYQVITDLDLLNSKLVQ
jgi:hypothetical protein